ncbi:MAG TPA: tetratricopeptide repeat protein, partial [Acidobacteriota bacterium]
MRLTTGCLVFFSASLLLSNECRADIIHLKNGRAIECVSATQDGDYVHYVVQGGRMTIPKSMVVKIEKTKVELKPQQKSSQSAQEEFANDESNIATTKAVDQSKTRAVKSLKNIETGRPRNVPISGNLEDYLKAYRQSRNEKTTMDLALAYFQARDDGNAEQYFQDALKMNPGNPDALYYLGEISWRREDLDQAQNYWQRAYNIDPDAELKQRLDSLAKEHKAAEAFEKDTSSHFLIPYDGGVADSSLVNEMSEYLETVYQELSQRFEAYPSEPFIVVLYPKQTFFDVTDMPAWSGGANDGKIKL